MAEIQCRHFTGYKPCFHSPICDRSQCHSFASVAAHILVIHLGALGAVLRSTSLIAAIRAAHPRASITWVTESPALLENLGIERVFGLNTKDLLALGALEFDLALVIDKSLAASGILNLTKAQAVRGFRADPVSGSIVPANPEARPLWEIGLSNAQKFLINKKSEQQLVHESLALGPYTHDEYVVHLSAEERYLSEKRRGEWARPGQIRIGINTGSSDTITAKKLSVEGHRKLIHHLRRDSRLHEASIILLGGREETERNQEIARGLDVICSPTDKGLRDGLASVAACDLVFSGDSLGMHMAIALKRWTVAWFGPTCAHEIDLYDRGVKIIADVGCTPCWKRDCQRPVMCYDQVDFARVADALAQGKTWLTSSFKPHIPEIYSSASHC